MEPGDVRNDEIVCIGKAWFGGVVTKPMELGLWEWKMPLSVALTKGRHQKLTVQLSRRDVSLEMGRLYKKNGIEGRLDSEELERQDMVFPSVLKSLHQVTDRMRE